MKLINQSWWIKNNNHTIWNSSKEALDNINIKIRPKTKIKTPLFYVTETLLYSKTSYKQISSVILWICVLVYWFGLERFYEIQNKVNNKLNIYTHVFYINEIKLYIGQGFIMMIKRRIVILSYLALNFNDSGNRYNSRLTIL